MRAGQGSDARKVAQFEPGVAVTSSRPFWRRALGIVLAPWPFVLIIAVWQAWIVFGRVPEIVAPSPLLAFTHAAEQLRAIGPDLLATLKVVAAGLTLGMSAGIALAIAAWFSPLLSGVLTPPTVLLNAIPSIALIPVLGSIFGFNPMTVVVVAALITFFPAFVLTRSGLDAVPPSAPDVLAALGANRRARFLYLALPAALPNMATALRIGAMLSVLGALTAEWLLGTDGLGFRLALAQQVMDTTQAWNISMVGVALSLMIFVLATLLERTIVRRFR
ncbi:ABC transporter permease [Pseudorhodoplanes sp.]|uniref:ABC transporter permease n=1 Tax=Pseudorhodoplanes sp. TaxID=1934341 RepID=UPI003D128D45